VYDDLGDKHKALTYYEQALPLRRAVGDRGGEATTLNNIGMVYRALGDNQKALTYYEQALPLFELIGDVYTAFVCCGNMGVSYHELNDLDRSITYLEKAIAIGTRINHPNLPACKNYRMNVKRQRGDADVPPESEPTPEEQVQAALKQLIGIYQAIGEDGLRGVLKQNNWSDVGIERWVQVVKDNLG